MAQGSPDFNIGEIAAIAASTTDPNSMLDELRANGLMIPPNQDVQYAPLIKDICLHILPKCTPDETDYIRTNCIKNLTIGPYASYANNHQIHRKMILPEETKLRRIRIAVLWLMYGKTVLNHKQVLRFIEDHPRALNGFPEEQAAGMRDIIESQKRKLNKQKRAGSATVDAESRKKIAKKTKDAVEDNEQDCEDTMQPQTPSQIEDTVMQSVENSPMDHDSPEVTQTRRPAASDGKKKLKAPVKVERTVDKEQQSSQVASGKLKATKTTTAAPLSTPTKNRTEQTNEALSVATSYTLRAASNPATPVRGGGDPRTPVSVIRHKSVAPVFDDGVFIDQETLVRQVQVHTPDATAEYDLRQAKRDFRNNFKATIVSMMNVLEASKTADKQQKMEVNDRIDVLQLQMADMDQRLVEFEEKLVKIMNVFKQDGRVET